MPRKTSIIVAARRAAKQDEKLRQKMKFKDTRFRDSFQNFQLKLGMGAGNELSGSTYGFNPITRNRMLLDWIHRGSWLGGIAVDCVADDMTRMGVSFKGNLAPVDIAAIRAKCIQLGLFQGINETIKWGRLYGGSIGVMLVDGQPLSTPLRVETIGNDQFRGIYAFDRWMVEPSLNDLVTDYGPDLGLPKFYITRSDAPALRDQRIHYTRCIRLEGIKVPYQQRMIENLWSISVYERLYDRMVAFDSASAGASQLVYKSYLRTYKVKDLREIVASGGAPMEGLIKYVDMMRRFQGIEGITLLDAEDEFEGHAHVPFSGISDALLQFGQQLAGALQIPLVRLFGQSPAGLNSTGESDLRTYYDGIKQQQEAQLHYPLLIVIKMVAQSVGITLPNDFDIEFVPLWQLTEPDKAKIAVDVTAAVTQATESGIIDNPTAMEELHQSSHITGVFSNITKESIDNSPRQPLAVRQAMKPKLVQATADSSSIIKIADFKRIHDLDIVIENTSGSVRTGKDWSVVMPDDYGYIRMTEGADGDQLDCYVGDNSSASHAYVIDQLDLSGNFDEHKVMLGYDTLGDALRIYHSGYHDGRGMERVGGITPIPMPVFKLWMIKADLSSPLSESLSFAVSKVPSGGN